MSLFKDKTLLITGGTGSFGNVVLNRFLKTDIGEIRIFSRDEKKQDDMRHDFQMRMPEVADKIKFYIGDVRDIGSVRSVMHGVDYIFHAAALKQVPSCEFFPMEAVRTNVIGTDNVLTAAIDEGVECVICLSTDKAAYPINSMGMTKAIEEKVAIAKSRMSGKTKICCTRYGNVMCSRGSVIPLWIDQIKSGNPITVTEPSRARPRRSSSTRRTREPKSSYPRSSTSFNKQKIKFTILLEETKMLHTINPEILFLKQEDVIKAGLLDMKQILAVTEKTYAMLGQGLIKNPPKTNTSIPDKENWQSFFNAMPCYIGGDINIGGIKWAAESKKNATIPGIPYGIDISILSDPETVLPFCILDGTLITAMRTSAVGGLMAKYAAPSDADTACLVGAGVIGRTMISAVHEALPQIKTMYLCDIDVAKAEGIAKEYGDSLGVEIIPTSDSKAAALKSQLIVGETTAPKPFMDTSWLTSGCGLVSMHSNEVMEDVFLKADGIVADYWTQLKQHTNPLSKLTKEGKLDESQIMDLSELVLGTKKLRTSDDQFVAAASMGLGALDIMIAYQLYLNATEMGIGTKVNLWDKPLWE